MAKKPEVKTNDAQPVRKARQRTAALVMPTYTTKNLPEGASVFVKILNELMSKPDVDHKTGEQKLDKQGKPAEMHLIQVLDLDTGEMGEMVVPIVMYNAFQNASPIAGKCFELMKGKAEANKATKWSIYQIADE